MSAERPRIGFSLPHGLVSERPIHRSNATDMPSSKAMGKHWDRPWGNSSPQGE